MAVLIPHITHERLLAFQSIANKTLKQRIADELQSRSNTGE
mgnify:CR=1 FL=1